MKKTLNKIKSMRFLALFLLMVVFSTIAATCDPAHDIARDNPALLRDYLFSVEPRNNGTYTVWVRNDSIGAYCTSNALIGENALEAISSHRSESIPVIIEYRYRKPGDREYNGFGDGGCSTEGNRYTGVTVYKILSIEVINSFANQQAFDLENSEKPKIIMFPTPLVKAAA